MIPDLAKSIEMEQINECLQYVTHVAMQWHAFLKGINNKYSLTQCQTAYLLLQHKSQN